MGLLLDLVYAVLLLAAAPWLIYQGWRKGKYRDGFAAKFLGQAPRRSAARPGVWLHAVSVGEVNLLVPLVAEIARRRPDCDCVVSTTTMTGFALARTRFPQLPVFYCPLDFSLAVRRAMRRVRPELLVLAELELWPNLIRAARRQGARVAVVNGRLSQRSFRGYLRLRPLLAAVLRQLDLVAAQTDEYAGRFCALGARAEAVHVTGSIKFDGAQAAGAQAEAQRLRALAGIEPDDTVFLAGSTQAPEEALALAAFRHWSVRFPQLKLIVVPRHPERFADVARLLADCGLPWRRRSELGQGPAPGAARILLVDKIGELRAWWGTARIGFVGGSLGSRGGQNMLEPAGWGCAVSFGPNTQNFRDVVSLLLQADAAAVVHGQADLTAFVGRCLEQPDWARALGRRALQVVESQRGATGRTVDLLETLLAPADAAAPHARDAA